MKNAEEILTVVSLICFAFFVLGAIGNWWRLIRGVFGHRKGSGIPLIPGVLGTVALLITPAHSDIAQWKSFWWLPLFADFGCIPWVVLCIWHFRKRKLTSTRKR